MDSPMTLTSALEAVSTANERIVTLEADLVAASALIERAAQMEAQLADLVANNLKLSEALQAAEQAARVQEIRVTEAIASVGVAPVAVAPEPQEKSKSKDELWAQYKSLSVYERAAFYQSNREILRS
jgi:small-conductance mechanosensitive channel